MALKDITVRQLTDEDLVEVSEWFASRKWTHPPVGATLPETGYVAEIGDKKLSVAWLYITNSAVGIIDWIATNPEAGYKGMASVRALIDHIEEVSRRDTKSYLHFTGNDKLTRYLKKKCRFKVAESGISMCVRAAR